jgi:CheY-like chemotaxis protein
VIRLTIATGDVTGIAPLLPDVIGHTSPPPPNQSHPDAPMLLRKSDLGGAHILLADDGADNRRLVAIMLRRAGAIVETADNGRTACDFAMANLLQSRPFDVILMDMQMPEMDGYEATARLRSLGYKAPIIALTAHAMSEDRDACLSAGCDDYITKPIDWQAFLATIAKHLRAPLSPSE